jgi:hypothetical protein
MVLVDPLRWPATARKALQMLIAYASVNKRL